MTLQSEVPNRPRRKTFHPGKILDTSGKKGEFYRFVGEGLRFDPRGEVLLTKMFTGSHSGRRHNACESQSTGKGVRWENLTLQHFSLKYHISLSV